MAKRMALWAVPMLVAAPAAGQIVAKPATSDAASIGPSGGSDMGGPGGTCYANCDQAAGATPFLTINDFVCFMQRFANGDSYANCDGSTSPPVLNVNDFVCFAAAFAAGCSAP